VAVLAVLEVLYNCRICGSVRVLLMVDVVVKY
jgi:hypothetical protein